MEALGVYSSQEIKAIEAIAVDKYRIKESLLMEQAALLGAEEVPLDRKILVLIGPGNNGGDGMALARILISRGADLEYLIPGSPDFKGPTLDNYLSLLEIKSPVDHIPKDLSDLVIIDSLFGISLNRSIKEPYKSIIERVSSSRSYRISLDIPSGLDPNTGEVKGLAFRAHKTITFIGYKRGLFLGNGPEYSGDIILKKLSIPGEALKNTEVYINTPEKFPEKPRTSYKTSNGRVLIIGGSREYSGAPYFAGKGALNSGCGYVTIITAPSFTGNKAYELIYKGRKELEAEVGASTTVIFGPGLGVGDEQKTMLKEVLSLRPPNLIIDGDGLTLLSSLGLKPPLETKLILTPHPGEAAQLLSRDISYILGNYLEVAREISEKYGAYVVLKGANSIIYNMSEYYISTNGSQLLSTAGSGDILSGILGAYLGYMDITQALKSGVYTHGELGKGLDFPGVGVDVLDLLGDLKRSFPPLSP